MEKFDRGELTTFEFAVIDRFDQMLGRFDRMIELLGGPQANASQEPFPPHRQVQSDSDSPPLSKRNPGTPKPLDPYHTDLAIKVLRILIRPDVRSVGKVSKSLAVELGLSGDSTRRVLNKLIKVLPFLSYTKEYVRILPKKDAEVEEWILKAEQMGAERTDFGAVNCSQMAFEKYAATLVQILLAAPDGRKTTELYQALGIKLGMLKGVLNRLAPYRFLSVPVSARGKPLTIRITNRTAAEDWLTKPEKLSGANGIAHV
jgi:hypothetical protein